MGLVREYLIMLIIVLVWLFLGFLRPVEPATITESTFVPTNTTIKTPSSMKEIEKQLESLLTSVTKFAMPYFVRNSDLNLSSTCRSTVMKMFLDFRKLKLPVFKLLDAMAKPPYGLLRGTLIAMGDYDGCLEVRANEKGDVPLIQEDEFYHGQYCTIEIGFPHSISDTIDDYNNKKVNITAFGKLGKFIAEFSLTSHAKEFFKYKIGICIPSTCTSGDLEEILRFFQVQFVPFLPMHVKHCVDGKGSQLNTDQAVFIGFLIFFGVMVLLGTLLEGWLYVKHSSFKGYHKNKYIQFLLAFSFYGNTMKLMKSERSTAGAVIPVINGMYVFGTFLVVIFHTYLNPSFLDFSSHGALYLGVFLKDWKFTFISTMSISIEGYFLFSGIFLTYPRYRTQEKDVKINVLQIIVRRYLRLCPSMLLILGIIVFLPLVGSGPMFPDILGVAAENTRKWWYSYVLMYNNFLPMKKQNFLYLWFVPCLMQITVIGAILLWIISKRKKTGIILTIATGVACNITVGVLTARRNYPPTYAMYWHHNRHEFEETIYTSPLSHVFSYLIGMLLGIFMAKNPTLKWSKTHVIIGWIASLLLTAGTQFLCYIMNDGEYDPTVAAIYGATHKTLFTLGMCWIILACTNGYGGVFANLMCWRGFGILAKLGYFGYLIHYLIIAFHGSTARVPLMYSHHELFLRYCAYILLTFAASYVLYITFELPLVFIESLFRSSRSSSSIQNNLNTQAKSTLADTIPVTFDVLISNILKTAWNESNLDNTQ